MQEKVRQNAPTHGKRFAERAEKKGINLVPPDGGWGWAIVTAFSVTHFFVVPIFLMFSLIFGEKLKRIGISATDISIILNTNTAIGFGFGLMNKPLLKRFTYRQLSLFGSFLLFSGLVLTSMANSMIFFILSYGIIYALGFSLTNQPQQYAMHCYFLHRRSRAMSIAVATCGFGPVLLPLLVGQFLEWYSPEGTILILAALVFHSLPASLLLQPVRWHMRVSPTETGSKEEKTINIQEADSSSLVPTLVSRRHRTTTVNSADIDCHSLCIPDTPMLQRDIRSQGSHRNLSISAEVSSQPILARSISQQTRTHLSPSQWWSSADTEVSSAQIFEDICLVDTFPTLPDTNYSNNNVVQQPPTKEMKKEMKKSRWQKVTFRVKSFGNSVVEFFDLGLFCLPGYTNIALGMSIGMFSEVNFTLLFPLIMKEIHGLSIPQVAQVIAVLSACDIISRFTSPYVAEWLHASHRTMYLVSLVTHIIVRSMMIVFDGYLAMLLLGGALGLGKGLRAVFMPLVIPSHVPLERLAAAMGLQLICNGILFITLGPLLGVMRDWSGSYISAVITINILTMITLIMWTGQSVIMWCKGYFTISQQ